MNFKLYAVIRAGIFFIPYACLLLASSCCKEGTDGKAVVVATIRHHSKPINGATLYIKFNSKELPGTSPSDFDASFPGNATGNTIRCENLKCGEYYLYVTGYDSSILNAVSGGIPLKIKHSQRKEELSLDIPVTEKH